MSARSMGIIANCFSVLAILFGMLGAWDYDNGHLTSKADIFILPILCLIGALGALVIGWRKVG